MESLDRHWTARGVDDFAYRIVSDFVAQIETKLEVSRTGRSEFAKAIGVTPGRVSQLLNNPTLFNLKSMVSYARGVGMKVAIVAYEDDDPTNDRGPINAQVFTQCWQNAGSPRDLYEPRGARFQSILPQQILEQSYYRGQIFVAPTAQLSNFEHTPLNCLVAAEQSHFSEIQG